MPFSHYSYKIVNGQRVATSLFQFSGEQPRNVAIYIGLLAKQNEYLAAIPDRLQPVVNLSQVESTR